MEQTDSGKGHGNSVFIADLDHVVVPHGAARLSDIADTALMRPLDVVAEGEEGVGA